MNEKNYQYLVGIAIIVLLVLVVYVSGRVSELEATVFGTGEAPGAVFDEFDEGDVLGYTYGSYDGYDPSYYQQPNYYTASIYDQYDPYYYNNPNYNYCYNYNGGYYYYSSYPC